MSWPSPEEFREALQSIATAVRHPKLSAGSIELDALGLPQVASGTFACVYKIHCNKTAYALRCFLGPGDDRADRYAALTDFITQDELEYTVDFEYLAQGVLVNGKWFPAIKMEWVEGTELDAYVHANIHDAQKLLELAEDFAVMMRQLHDAGIAHGDLQHGNVIITGGGIRLVDYDGMYVPSLKGRTATELGHPNYQHPARSNQHFGTYLDNFSAWLIHLSLQCLARDPMLWHGLRDCLLVSRRDLHLPEASIAFSTLEHHTDESIRRNARRIRQLLGMEPSEVPALHRPFELEKLPPLLTPQKLRERLRKELEEELAQPVSAPATGAPLRRPNDRFDRLRVTSEVQYLGLPLGINEFRLMMRLRQDDLKLEPAGRDAVHRLQYYRAAVRQAPYSEAAQLPPPLLTLSEFLWVPYFGFAYHEGDTVLVKIKGQIDPAKAADFAVWARQNMRGTWVTDGTSRFQFCQDTGSLSFDLAAFKPRHHWSKTNPFWDWWFNDPPELHLVARGRYQIEALRWGWTFDILQNKFAVFNHRQKRNCVFVRAPEPIEFCGVKLSPEFRLVQLGILARTLEPSEFPSPGCRLYEVRFSIPSGLRQTVMESVVRAYGWPDRAGCWHDSCATPWAPDNTVMTWTEDELIVTYMPLARKSPFKAKGAEPQLEHPSR